MPTGLSIHFIASLFVLSSISAISTNRSTSTTHSFFFTSTKPVSLFLLRFLCSLYSRTLFSDSSTANEESFTITMSNPAEAEDEEEESGEGEEEEELFYESLDRVLSAASSSCSSSDVEEPEEPTLNYVPRFPNSLSSTYEVWITEPSSVEERRKRLLQEMGLSSDPSLSRLKPLQTLKERSSNDSSSSDAQELKQSKQICVSCGILRSKSDSATSSSGHRNCCCSSSSSSIASTSIHSINSIQNQNGSFVNSEKTHLLSKSRSNNGSIGSCVTANFASSPNKPPTGKSAKRVEEIRADSANPNRSENSGDGEVVEGSEDCDGVEKVCTIKNLDNGKEFVVNEIREDGMWNKVREVGTGRQLTMEEFEMCVGHSPIVQELMRRQNVEQLNGKKADLDSNGDSSHSGGAKSKKKGSWLQSIKNVAISVTGHRERRSSDERDTSSEKGGRRSSSATDDSQETSFHGPERVRVRQYGKSCKEVTGLYKCQEIQAHNGSIWCIKFSLDGRYLASAGEDCVIHVWQVGESQRKGDLLLEKSEDVNLNLYFGANGSPELALVSSSAENHLEKKRRGRTSIGRKSISLDHIVVPETVFALSEKPVCSFRGHLDDVLDLSWSKSQYLLSSSMDKTVRLWQMGNNACLKVFSHSDYVTCIQFNPVDDNYFISGSLDAKVRIWSIPDRQVVDWNDLHEMVTAACYTPDGQGALVGSYKGTCCLYNTLENKLHQKSRINLQNRKKKSHLKKITGFQFAPGSSSEVLITSADSRIRVIDGVDLVHKFKGFRNTSSQISASLTTNGKYVVCASGDSYVYVWNHENDSRPSRSKGVTVTGSYEYFHCQDVSVAIPWPGISGIEGSHDTCGESNGFGSLQGGVSPVHNSPLLPEEANGQEGRPSVYGCNSPLRGVLSSANSSYFYDRISATWPEEKLVAAARNRNPRCIVDFSNDVKQGSSAWGMVIVTAGLRGEIKIFQNFGLLVRL